MSKLAFEFLQKKKDWASFLYTRFYKDGQPLQYYKSSSIWNGIKAGLSIIALDTEVILYRDSNASLWQGNCVHGRSLSSILTIPNELKFTRDFSVSRFLDNSIWSIPGYFSNALAEIGKLIQEIEISDQNTD